MEDNITQKTKFSVAMCVYGKDNPEWFRRALESVYRQTLMPSEVVLVVDGPIDQSLQKVIDYYKGDENFKAIYLETNQGHGNARRKSLESCSYELVALMDADDVCLPDRFEKQLQVFNDNNEVSVVGGNISEFIEQEENIIGYRIVPEKHDDIVKYMKLQAL